MANFETPPVPPVPPTMRIGDVAWQDLCDEIAAQLGYKGGPTSREEAVNLSAEDRDLQNRFSEITSKLVRDNTAAWAQYNKDQKVYLQAKNMYDSAVASRSPEAQAAQTEAELAILLDPATPNAVRADLILNPRVMALLLEKYPN